MQDLNTLPERTLLREWATYTGKAPLQHLTQFLVHMGYVKCTKRHPGGRALTTADVRRTLDRFLKSNPHYPHGRPPTEADFNRIKVDILTEYDEEELV